MTLQVVFHELAERELNDAAAYYYAQDRPSESVGKLAVEASRDFPSPALLDALLQLKSWWDVDAELLESAISKCRKVN